VQDLEYLIRRADPRRVMFGSDFPEASIAESVQFVLGAAERVGLTPSHLDAILFENAERLLKGPVA